MSFCFLSKTCFSTGAQMWADVGLVIGAVAAVSLMMTKSKLVLVRHQRVKATGVDITLTLCCTDTGMCMPSCFMNEGNLLAYVCVHNRFMFSKLATPPGDNPWDTSNQPQCMCDTCFFIQSSCLFIFRHHQSASCYFLPSSGQTNNRCGWLERTLPSTSPLLLLLCCDESATTFALSISPLSLVPALLFP